MVAGGTGGWQVKTVADGNGWAARIYGKAVFHAAQNASPARMDADMYTTYMKNGVLHPRCEPGRGRRANAWARFGGKGKRGFACGASKWQALISFSMREELWPGGVELAGIHTHVDGQCLHINLDMFSRWLCGRAV